MSRTRVLYIVRGFPQISQTYVKAELEAVYADYEIRILCRKPANVPYENHYPYEQINGKQDVLDAIADFRPDVLHTHYLNQLDFIGPIAEETGLPFTLRSHSFDAMTLKPKTLKNRIKSIVYRKNPQFRKVAKIRGSLHWVNHPLCLGVLAFPWARPLLQDAGVNNQKIIDCSAVVDYASFHDESPNGNAIMNTGAAIEKKRMEDYLALAAAMPDQTFNLYAMGYRADQLEEKNTALGGHVNFMPIIQPLDMPAEYKKHRWLVYTADFELATVGWPMAVAEAQAAGTGVCMPNIRPDIRDYVGEAGYLYDDVGELRDIISRPVPEAMRMAGFEQAKKADIAGHKHLLTDLWESVGRNKRQVA